MKARPGGSIQPFCEAVATTSQPQASVDRGSEQTLLMPSTSNSLSNSPFTTLATASRSLVTPVDVSLWATNTAFTAGFAFRQSRSTSVSTALPKGNSNAVTSAPNASAICPNRLPNTPMVTFSTLSPGESVFTMAASIAPVPEAVRM